MISAHHVLHESTLLSSRSLRAFAAALIVGLFNPLLWSQTSQWSSGSNGTIYYNGGNVGLGTTNPPSKLTSVTLDGGTAYGSQIAAMAGGTAQGQRAVYSLLPTFQGTADNSPRRAADIVGGFNGCPWGCEYLSFNVGAGGASNDAGNLTIERMRIAGNGNIGIGTATPTGRVDIQGISATNAYTAPADAADLRILSSNNRPYDGAILELGGSWGATGYIKTEAYSGNAGAMTFGTRRNGGETTMQPAMTLSSNGYVGIGTTNPQYQLAVNGVIQAKEVLVNTGWSDYVFESGYKLPSLENTAAYIRLHHHLPGIPTQAEVKEKGVSVGDAEAKLLAKVEELTLQMIQLNETNKQLAQRVAQLEHRQ